MILLRNLNIKEGLCNGTRLRIMEMKEHVLAAEIITGAKKGNIVFIPRIELSPSKKELPLNMVRRQFPIRLGYALTINKSQGQSFDYVGIYLPIPVFGHGQLYVALSRCTSREKLKILLTEKSTFENINCKKMKNNTKNIWTNMTDCENTYTTNIVYQEILNY